MTIPLNDPKLTAYALDELDGPDQSKLEAALQNSPDHEREITQIRLIAQLLRAELELESLHESRPPLKIQRSAPRRSRATHFFLLAVAASIIVALVGTVVYFSTSGPASSAFAQTIDQVAHAKSMTWKSTFYNHAIGKSGTTWLVTETRQIYYKAPGLYREVSFDDKGQPRGAEITDAIHMHQLSLNFVTKEAFLSEPMNLSGDEQPEPFAWELKDLSTSNLQWVGKRRLPVGEVNVFRHSLKNPDGKLWSYDYWIDASSKRLIEVRLPGQDIYDPDTDLTRNNKPEAKWTKMTAEGGGHISHDIQYDVSLDASLFSLTPPDGFKVVTVARPKVTESQMIDYLRIMADFNDKVFPDEPFTPLDKLNKVLEKPRKDRTPAEQKLISTENHYMEIGMNALPLHQYRMDETVPGTFRYLGKGVRLGDKDRIVCWYKPKDANNYHVVYGDLTVKEMPASSLPLPAVP